MVRIIIGTQAVTTPPLLVRRIEVFQFFEMTSGSSTGFAVALAHK